MTPLSGLLAFLAHDYVPRAVGRRWDALVPVTLQGCFALIIGERPNDPEIAEFLERLHRTGSRPPLVIVAGPKNTPWTAHAERQTGVDGLIFTDARAEHQIHAFRLLAGNTTDRTIAQSDPAIARIWTRTKDVVHDLTARIRAGQPIPRADVQALATSVVETLDSSALTDFLALLRQHHAESVVHGLDVGITALLLGRHIGVRRKADELRLFETGLLHDVGKLAMPLPILQKPGKLTDEETAVIQRHPIESEKILRHSGAYDDLVIRAAVQHHERLDGTGYPHHLPADGIHDLSRLIAVCDVFCALTEHRSYRPKQTPEDAVPILRDMSGNHLDPIYVERLIELVNGDTLPPKAAA
ncbi:MAG: HD domain-containing protein [Rhodospirillaceae bacterium]|nr:HD domain-containing protein [Rhodospirillaceae bacterium]